jgi:hypothetical protein
MAKTLIFRNATTSGLATQTGSLAELFVDTTKKTVVVMDGVTPGGQALATDARATTSTFGLVRANNTSITVNNGTLSLGSSITQTWTIQESAIGSLLFYKNGVLVFGLSSSGAIVCSGSVTSFGTPT